MLPRLEEPLARHELGDLADEITWCPGTRPTTRSAWSQTIVAGSLRVAVQDQMWARFALRLRAALDPAELVEAGPTMSALRRIKSPEEVDRLRCRGRGRRRAPCARSSASASPDAPRPR